MRLYAFASQEIKPDFLSRRIMNRIGAPYSHVGLVVGESETELFSIYHSVGTGVGEVDVAEFLLDHAFVELLELTDFIPDMGFAMGWLNGSIGKDYSESQYLGFLFSFLKRFVGDGKREMICSEFAARFVNECTDLNSLKFMDDRCDFIDPKEFITNLKAGIHLSIVREMFREESESN